MGVLRALLQERFGETVVKIGIRLADIQLLRAECLARTDRTADAITILEAFRTTRMPAADAKVTTSDKTALIRFESILQ